MDEELRQLKIQLAEEQRRREDAERRREEEQRRREEEQRRREEEQRKREEEERKREDAERAAASALSAAASALNQDLIAFLTGCHHLSRLIRPVDEILSATTGSTTKPTGRLYPQSILPWSDFSSQQRSIWDRLSGTDSVWTSRVYTSATNFDFLRKKIEPISSEDELRYLQRLIVEEMVKQIFEELEKDDQLDESLRTGGRMSFENQASFREAELAAAMTGLSFSSSAGPSQPRNTRADQFCVLWNRDGTARPVVAIEYKAPHKLTIKQICTGLQGEIRPETDVIDKDDDDFEFLCKNLMAAVLTQLFSYMIEKGVRYGYVCTGEAYIFMHIPVDPTTVYYSVNVPRQDFDEDAEHRLERTAVSQVFAFVRQALEDEPADQAWMATARTKLKRWKVEFIDVLSRIPETERKSRDASAYKPGRWAPSDRTSPIVLRKRCINDTTTTRRESDSEDSSEDDGTKGSSDSTPSRYIETTSRSAKSSGATKSTGEQTGNGKDRAPDSKHTKSLSCGSLIQSRPYCTHKCLRGLCQRLPLDPECPNVATHGRKHIPPKKFLQLVRQQLAVDRGTNADCCALYIHGARGALLKVRLTSHGYTLVAKAVETCNLRYLQNEERVYAQLANIQGQYVPVCCGLSKLDVPYYYDGAELTHLLLMSWAGKSFVAAMRDNSIVPEHFERYSQLCMETLKAIHGQAVLHRDVEPRNIVFNSGLGTLMLVDFERSEVRDRRALGELSPNRKRKHMDGQDKKAEADCFEKEVATAEFSMRKAFSLAF